MKKIKVIISVIALAALMLVSLGAQASGSLSIATDVFNGLVMIEASFDECKNEPVSIQVVPLETDIDAMANDLSYAYTEMIYFNQFNSDDSGKVSENFEFNGKSGKYIVRVHSMSNPDLALEKLLEYVSYDDALSAWNNLTESPEENLEKLISILDIDDELVISMKDDSEILDLISAYDHIGEFTKTNAENLFEKIYEDCSKIKLNRDVLSKIASADNKSQIKSIITDEANAASLCITEYLDRYNALKNTDIVDKAIAGKTFEDSAAFAKAFKKALKDAEDAENDKPSKPGSNGKGSGSSSSLGTSINVSPVTVVPDENALPFKDIDNVPWAKDAIVDLYANGIINGKSETVFAPNDYILREEFVKMIVNLLGVEVADVTTSFADVDSNAWYAPYIAASQKAGFINGYSDTVFGVGNYITRQDVAVILSRIANLSDSANSVAFSDDADISDYAKDAVKILSSNGIIAGSNGAFMPNNNSTRAETAVMIYRLAQKIKEGV